MSIQVQSIQAADLEMFLDFCGELYAFDGQLDNQSAFDPQPMRAAARQLLENPHLGRAVWLLVDGERAGYLVLCFGWSFEFGGRTAILEHLWVREGFRRRGIASAAIEWADALCQAESVKTVYLGVATSNQAAQNLYEKQGYQNSDLLFWIKEV